MVTSSSPVNRTVSMVRAACGIGVRAAAELVTSDLAASGSGGASVGWALITELLGDLTHKLSDLMYAAVSNTSHVH